MSFPSGDAAVPATSRTAFVGAGYAVAAYLTWALLALYWKALAHVPAIDVMLHRAVWSVLFILVLIAVSGRLPMLAGTLRKPKSLAVLAATAALLASNWYMFIWAMQLNYALEASLGYYINPLVNVLLGVVILREPLSRIRRIAVGLATVGVTLLSVSLGVPPYLALFLALTFGLYGLLRKMAPADPLVGLAIESGWMALIAIPWLLLRESEGFGGMGRFGPGTDALLVAAGVVTAVPLIWFNAAAKRLQLSTLGLFQYIAPTGMFLIAVFINGEALTTTHIVTFVLIWAALGLVAFETLRNRARVA
ncbi:EamA family transporter RarD [Zavarzinia aquatilis]|uniref:EamA family transporter RarD n=1 Tax=Zavarzinia aquatilis TaxID=2211142 RepID=A0A317E7K1_9PROT|nr:EamA family transporter RarD [Zavarzinia aquatilis]PWR21383.1 EamA family transporter RarD [Zavarzinia aquatilis]